MRCLLVDSPSMEGTLFNKRYTVLIIPDGAREVRRLELRRRLLRGVSLAAILVVCATGLLCLDYIQLHFDRSELVRLQVENREKTLEIARFSAEIESLQADVELLVQNDAMVRAMAKLDPPAEDALSGVGGPSPLEDQAEMSDLQREIDTLRRQIELRRFSQEEIQGFLNDEHSLLAAKPSGWPTQGWLTSLFGKRNDPFTGKRKMHEGLDIAGRVGTPILATADGVVNRVGHFPGYGKLVVIDHGYGYQTYYGHNSKLYVKAGQRVKRGSEIAALGNTGSSTGPHVHYEIRRNGVPINPRKYL